MNPNVWYLAVVFGGGITFGWALWQIGGWLGRTL